MNIKIIVKILEITEIGKLRTAPTKVIVADTK